MSRPSSASSSGSKKSRNRGKRWDPLPVPDITGLTPDDLAKKPLPAGFTVTFYPHNMSKMYTAPSEFILCTKGVMDYINEYNQHGPNKTKTKLYTCTMYMTTGECSNGFQCREVHYIRKGDGDFAVPEEIKSNTVHHRDAELDAYPRLPAGYTIPLSLPNMNVSNEKIPTDNIFITKGVQEYFDEMLAGGEPTMNMQHCAHFAKNGMCCFGPDCRFVHVAQYAIDLPSSSMDSMSSRSSRSTSSSSRGSSRREGKKSVGNSFTRENPLSMDDDRGGRSGRNHQRNNHHQPQQFMQPAQPGQFNGQQQQQGPPPTYIQQAPQPQMFPQNAQLPPGQMLQMIPPTQPGQQPMYVIVQQGQQGQPILQQQHQQAHMAPPMAQQQQFVQQHVSPQHAQQQQQLPMQYVPPQQPQQGAIQQPQQIQMALPSFQQQAMQQAAQPLHSPPVTQNSLPQQQAPPPMWNGQPPQQQ